VDLVFVEPVGVPTLFTDESKVSQIIRNFVSNALKFTERGSVTVRATLDEDGEHVLFSVADTGIGIALEDTELIFEEFAQIPNPMQRRVRGTGLGLPLCRRLATLLGGDVSVESTPGEGSTFLARLPARFHAEEPVPPPVAPDASEPEILPELKRVTSSGDDRLALIIDDDDAARYVIRRSLRQPMRFEEARDGPSGLELAARCRPAVIFLDLSMPGMRGDEVLERLKADPDTAHIPVIVVTSHELDPALRARLESQARAIVYKSDLTVESLAFALDGAGLP
jgi:CheY-like chemotaxis protein